MFKNKGQSALEYLMTYGWALVVIVIVIAVLVFLINPTQIGTNTCTGFDKLPIKGHKVYTGTGGTAYVEYIVTNMTGGNLAHDDTTFTLAGTSTIGTTTVDANTTKFAISANAEQKVTHTISADVTSGDSYSLNLTVAYTDKDGFSRTATASCKGTVD